MLRDVLDDFGGYFDDRGDGGEGSYGGREGSADALTCGHRSAAQKPTRPPIGSTKAVRPTERPIGMETCT